MTRTLNCTHQLAATHSKYPRPKDIFQSVMTDIFSDIKGVEVIVDDILIWARNEEEHNTILRKVLERARQRNLRLNKEKSTC